MTRRHAGKHGELAMSKKLLLSGAAASALLFASAAQAAPIIVIDNFSTPLTGGVIAVTAGNTVSDLSTGLGIIDGDRELIVSNTGAAGIDPTIFAEIIGGKFTHNNGSGSTGTSLLRWDGAGNGVNDLDFGLNAGAGYDLSGGGLALHISVTDADLDGSTVQLRMYNDADSFAVATVNLPDGASEHFFLLSDIESLGVGGFSLAGITAIELFANGGPSFDVAIDIIEVVPEPLTIGLFGLGLLGIGAARRRSSAA